MGQYEAINLAIVQLMDVWNAFTRRILQNPETLIDSQKNYWQDYQRLWQDFPGAQTATVDKRFLHKEWHENALYNFIQRSYLLLCNHIESLMKEIAQHDEDVAKKIKFFTRQFLDAASPTNFINTNPDVISTILETNGTNLIAGYQQFIQDFEQGQFNIKMTDMDLFQLGDNIACTPGKVIYQNDLMQLIQYTATTEQIYQYPLLIIPPWINKYYILDLQKENSLVKWLVDQGFTVFMISWVNPASQHKEKQFEDYMFEGPLAALNIIKKMTGENKTNVLGYCIGGTLSGCMLAYLAQKNDSRIKSATFLTTLLDFREPGELGAFIDEKQISLLETYMEQKGYLDGNIMASVFNALRANDLIWSSFVNHYLKGQKPKAFDLLYWNCDSTNIPERVHRFYLRNMYLHNHLVQPNKIVFNQVPLDLAKITVPSYFLAAQDDHIVPWTSVYKSKQHLGGPIKFVLTSSGHVAGVINPPHKMKYGYWTNNRKPKKPEKYLSGADYHAGSWWEDWAMWLKKYSGNLCPVNRLNLAAQQTIEAAPGSYVKRRLIDMKSMIEMTKP